MKVNFVHSRGLHRPTKGLNIDRAFSLLFELLSDGAASANIELKKPRSRARRSLLAKGKPPQQTCFFFPIFHASLSAFYSKRD